MTEVTELSLESLAGGGALELFDRELRRVIENIRDPNTPWKGARTVRLELKVAAIDDQREQIGVSTNVTSKLAGPRPLTQAAYLGEKDGRPVAVTYDPRQGDIFRGDTQVRPIASAKERV